jgi:hypothetical protein
MNRWQIHLTRESVKHADQLFFSLCFVLFPTEFLEAYVFRNSYICDAPGILGIDMRRPRHLTWESVMLAQQMFLSLHFVLFPTQFLEACVS